MTEYSVYMVNEREPLLPEEERAKINAAFEIQTVHLRTEDGDYFVVQKKTLKDKDYIPVPEYDPLYLHLLNAFKSVGDLEHYAPPSF